MLPEAFRSSIISQLGPQKAESLFRVLDTEPPVSIRLHHSKLSEFPGSRPAPFSRYGRILSARPQFKDDPLFHAGAYYVQEASSMTLESLLPLFQEISHKRGGLKVLDLCAAPGGKSTHLLSLLGLCEGPGLLLSNEVVRSRAAILADNIAKWGCSNSIVTSLDPSVLGRLEGFFDVIVVDAPCSGEGMFRKDHNARNEWSEDNVALCAARQKRILADIWPALSAGGILAYSTCTFNSLENEDNLLWACSNLGASLADIPGSPETGRHYYPGEDCGEGFFLGALVKDGEYRPFRTGEKDTKGSLKPFKDKIDWVNSEDFVLYRKGNLVKAYPKTAANAMLCLENRLNNVLSAGTAVAQVIEGARGYVLVPDADLALSEALKPAAFPTVALDTEQARGFISREPLILPSGTPKGYVLLTYSGLPLGFAKNIGTRANNLWKTRL
ncbi:MAG: rRNA cytosine-C5-methyltransferase [Bacteroidales bacterium]|nr:rRNA cytosine-C5-methyltransferase [Bacteroidales bacterium]